MASPYSPRYCIEEFLGSLRRLKCYYSVPHLCICSSSSTFRFSFSKSNGYMPRELQVFNGLFRTVVSLYEPYPGGASPCVDILVTECGLDDLPQRARCASQDIRLKLLHRLRCVQSPHHLDVGEPNLKQVGMAVSVHHHHGVRCTCFQSYSHGLLWIRMSHSRPPCSQRFPNFFLFFATTFLVFMFSDKDEDN